MNMPKRLKPRGEKNVYVDEKRKEHIAMDCQRWEERIDSWMTEAWEHGEGHGGGASPLPAELLEHARTCRSCATRLEAARQLVGASNYAGGSLYTRQYPDLTESMANRVMDRVLTMPTTQVARAKPSLWHVWRHKFSFALAAVALASMVFLSTEFFIERTVPQSQPVPEYATVRLQIELPQAQDVVVVGDWNQWDPAAQRLARVNGSDIWVIELNLAHGKEYRYQFVIDGAMWIPDPLSPLQVDDGFGGKNSVLET